MMARASESNRAAADRTLCRLSGHPTGERRFIIAASNALQGQLANFLHPGLKAAGSCVWQLVWQIKKFPATDFDGRVGYGRHEP
jgi:hypothetical protein